MTVAETNVMGNVKALAGGECEIYACADVFKAVCKVRVEAAWPGDGPGATTGNLRVVRGDSRKNDETYSRITARYGCSANAGYDCNGLRLVPEP